MKALLRLMATLTLAILATGCLKMTIVISVNPDGSGTIQLTHLMANTAFDATLEQARAQGTPMTLNQIKPQVRDQLMSKSMLLDFGKQFGAVKLKNRDDVDMADYFGVKATYTFADINAIDISSISPLGAGGQGGGIKYGASFKFDKMAKQLTIITKSADKSIEKPMTDQQITQLMKQLDSTTGSSLSLQVKLPGTLTKTNATHADKTTGVITLLTTDLDTLKNDKEKLKTAMKEANSFEGLLGLNLKGIKAEKQGKTLSATFE